MTAIYEQIVNSGMLYINGMVQSNNATTPNSQIDISPGMCRDSTNSFDINLGNFLGENPNISANQVTTINALASGANGLDTGSFQSSKVYNIFVIADISGSNPTACILSLSSVPVLPFGYGAYRLIGYAVSDSSTHFLKMYVAGSNSSRKFVFDAPQATSITAGAATSYTAIDLSALVPAVDNMPVNIAFAFTPAAAGHALNLTPGNGVGNAVTITGQVSSVIISDNVMVLSQLVTALPKIKYKVANGSDAVAIDVAGFDYYV